MRIGNTYLRNAQFAGYGVDASLGIPPATAEGGAVCAATAGATATSRASTGLTETRKSEGGVQRRAMKMLEG